MEKTRETISLDSRAQQRLYVLNHVLAGELTTEEASRVLQLSVRQVRRLVDRYRADGVATLVHGNRGRVPVNRTDPAIRARLVELATTEFAGFNPVHLAEILAEEGHADLAVSARTIRRIMAAAGKALPRTRRPPRHRSRRERMPRAGMLLQVDGSRHDWLEGRGPMLTLVGAIDDATGIVTAATFRGSAGSSQMPRSVAVARGSSPSATRDDRREDSRRRAHRAVGPASADRCLRPLRVASGKRSSSWRAWRWPDRAGRPRPIPDPARGGRRRGAGAPARLRPSPG
ncbi:MAG: helix-turn-helix domain-containing protein [Candidatus Limnocylindria bacterium]